ncbi:MAG: DUF5011 domain-containing protein [Acholeplasmataceae bacterium]|nr:DUF5011 domain-containing protein [Acholeplasmataceae bacterium]
MRYKFIILILILFMVGCQKEPTPIPIVELSGDSEITIEVGGEYEELGAIATYNNETFDVRITSQLDTTTLGTYVINYCAIVNSSCVSEVVRTVHVVDSTSPVLSLNTNSAIVIEYGTDIKLDDFIIAEDNYDTKDMLDFHFSKQIDYESIGSYRLYFNATDSSGNQSNTITCTVNIVDSVSPNLSVVNHNPIEIEAGIDELPLNYFIYNDNYDALEEIKIFIENEDQLEIGTTQVNIFAKDSSGNLSLPVEVTLTLTDTTAPTLAFSELDDFTHELGSEFSNEYLVLYDNYNQYDDITLNVTGHVDINMIGEYEMSYYAIDSNGNQSGSITKKVTVVERDDTLNAFERYMKDHTSLYDPVKFVNTYLYDPMEKCYRGLILNHNGGYDLAYYFFLDNYPDGEHVLRKIVFVNPSGPNIEHVLQDDIHEYVFRIPVEYAIGFGSFTVLTYPHEENNVTVEYWQGSFSFNNANNLDVDYLLTLDLKPGNCK